MEWWTHKKRKIDGTKHLQNNIAISESHRASVVKNQLYFIYKNVILTVQSKNVKSTLQYAPGHRVYFRSPTSPAPTLFSLSETDLVALRNRLRGAWKGFVLILITCIRISQFNLPPAPCWSSWTPSPLSGPRVSWWSRNGHPHFRTCPIRGWCREGV